MPYSYAVYTGNGTNDQFTVSFPYIRKEHVFASVDYVNATFTWVNNSTIQLDSVPANAARVEVRRTTPVNAPLVDFTDGSSLVAADLDTNALQQTYINQEQDDQFQDAVFINSQGLLDAGGKRITSVGDPVNAQDAATKNWVETAGASPLVQFRSIFYGAYATDPVVDPYGAARTEGDLYFNTTLDQMRVFNGTSWQEASADATITRFLFTAAGGETSLSGNDDNAQSLTYNVGLEMVYLNGALLTRGVDYTATTGSSITGLVALAAADLVEVVAFSQINALDSIPGANIADGTITSAKITDGTIVNADVNASAGIVASKLSFTQAGAGATARTVDSKLKDVVSVKDFGAVGDGVANDTAAIQAAINYVAAKPFAGGRITLDGQGLYYFTNLTFPSDTSGNTNGGIILDGNGCRMIKTSTTGTGILVQGAAGSRAQRRQGSAIRNVRFSVTAAQSSGEMIKVLNADHTCLENLDIESASTGITVIDSFCTRINASYIRNSALKDIYVYGSSGLSTVETYITSTVGEGVVGNTTKVGLVIDSGASGVYATDCDFIHGAVGISIVHTAQANPLYRPEWLFFNTVLADTTNAYGWSVSGDLDGMFLDNCWASSCNQVGFGLDAGSNICLNNCTALNNGQHGIELSGTVSEISISGGRYLCNSTSASGIYNGIRVGANLSKFSVSGARIGNPSSIGLPGVQSAAIYVTSGSSDSYQLIGNNCTDSSGSAIVDLGAGLSKKISDNLGFNPVGYVNIALPASLTAYTNNTGTDSTVYVSGGTVTAMEINFKGTGWVSTGLTSGAVSVPANTAIRLTYSVAPNWIWFFN